MRYNYKGGKANCKKCDKKLSYYNSNPKRTGFCKPCAGLLRRGENNYKWKGGNPTLERTRFKDLIQKQVFARDNYTCQQCGVKGGKLQVDHIQSWAEYVELRFNMNNCRTLCMACHYQITFGKPMPKNIKSWGHNLVRRVAS